MLLSWRPKGGGRPASPHSLLTAPLLLLVLCLSPIHTTPEVTLTLNTRKVVRTLDERFLSFTVDPEELVKRNYGPISKSMAQALAPAYLRIAGPSSNNLTFHMDRIGLNSHVISANTWRELNTFLNHSGINVIICLNVLQRLHNVWDSSNAVEMVNTIEKMGLPLDYQLGYENQEYLMELSSDEVAHNVVRLRSILDTFSNSKASRIIGPDFTQFNPDSPEQMEFVKNFIKTTNYMIDAITVHPSFSLEKDVSTAIAKAMNTFDDKFFMKIGARVKPIWLAESELEQKPAGLDATINSLIELGVAAQSGADMFLLRPQPFCPEHTTPDFWMAALHKALVGSIVLSSKSSVVSGPLRTFVHCTKPTTDSNPNNYEAGSVTIFGTNMDAAGDVNLVIKNMGLVRDEAAHVFLLTQDSQTGKSYLNEKELSIASNGELPVITPYEKELLGKGLADNIIRIPKKSIFFIVLPENRAKSCMNRDKQNRLTQSLLNRNSDVKLSSKNFLGQLAQFKNIDKPKEEFLDKPDAVFDWSKQFSSKFNPLGSNRDNINEDEVKTKYVTFSDNNWLSKFPEKVHKNTLFDDEFPKNTILDFNKNTRYRRHRYTGHYENDSGETGDKSTNNEDTPQNRNQEIADAEKDDTIKSEGLKEMFDELDKNEEPSEILGFVQVNNEDSDTDNIKTTDDSLDGENGDEIQYFTNEEKANEESKHVDEESLPIVNNVHEVENVETQGKPQDVIELLDIEGDKNENKTSTGKEMVETDNQTEYNVENDNNRSSTDDLNVVHKEETDDLDIEMGKDYDDLNTGNKELDDIDTEQVKEYDSNIEQNPSDDLNTDIQASDSLNIEHVKESDSLNIQENDPDDLNVENVNEYKNADEIEDKDSSKNEEKQTESEYFPEKDKDTEAEKLVDKIIEDIESKTESDSNPANESGGLEFQDTRSTNTTGNSSDPDIQEVRQNLEANLNDDLAKTSAIDDKIDQTKGDGNKTFTITDLRDKESVLPNEKVEQSGSDKSKREDILKHLSSTKEVLSERTDMKNEETHEKEQIAEEHEKQPQINRGNLMLNFEENRTTNRDENTTNEPLNNLKIKNEMEKKLNIEDPGSNKKLSQESSEFNINQTQRNIKLENKKDEPSENTTKLNSEDSNVKIENKAEVNNPQNKPLSTNIMKIKKKSKRNIYDSDLLLKNEKAILNEHRGRMKEPTDEDETAIFVPQISMFDSNFHKIGVLDESETDETKPLKNTNVKSEVDNVQNNSESKLKTHTKSVSKQMEDEVSHHIEEKDGSTDKSIDESRVNTQSTREPKTIINEKTKSEVNDLDKKDDFTNTEEREVIKRVSENRKRSPSFSNYFDFSEPFSMPFMKGTKKLVDYPSYKNIIHHTMSYSPSKVNVKDTPYVTKPAVTNFLPNNHVSNVNMKTKDIYKSTTGTFGNKVTNHSKIDSHQTELGNQSKYMEFDGANNKPDLQNHKNITLLVEEQKNVTRSNINKDTTDNTTSFKTNEHIKQTENITILPNITENTSILVQDVRNVTHDNALNGTENKVNTSLKENPILNFENEPNVKHNFKRSYGTLENDYENTMSHILHEYKEQEGIEDQNEELNSNFEQEKDDSRKKSQSSDTLQEDINKYSADTRDREENMKETDEIEIGIPKNYDEIKSDDVFNSQDEKSVNDVELNEQADTKISDDLHGEEINEDQLELEPNDEDPKEIIPEKFRKNIKDENEARNDDDLDMFVIKKKSDDLSNNFENLDLPLGELRDDTRKRKLKNHKWKKVPNSDTEDYSDNEEDIDFGVVETKNRKHGKKEEQQSIVEEDDYDEGGDEVKEKEPENQEGSDFFKNLLKFKNIHVSNDEDSEKGKNAELDEVEEEEENEESPNEEGSAFFKTLLKFKNVNVSNADNDTDQTNSSDLTDFNSSVGHEKNTTMNSSNNGSTLNNNQGIKEPYFGNINTKNSSGETKPNEIIKSEVDENQAQKAVEEKVQKKRVMRNINNENYNLGLSTNRATAPTTISNVTTVDPLVTSDSNSLTESSSFGKASPSVISYTSTEKPFQKIHTTDSIFAEVKSVQDEANYNTNKQSDILKPISTVPLIQNEPLTVAKSADKPTEEPVNNNVLDDKSESSMFKHGYHSETPLLYNFFSTQQSKDSKIPLVYPSVIPKDQPINSDIDISKSYSNAYDYSKHKLIENNTHLYPIIPKGINTPDKNEILFEKTTQSEKQGSLKSKHKKVTKNPIKEPGTQDFDVISEIKKALLPNGTNKDKGEKPIKKTKTLADKLKELKLKREKLKKSISKKEISETDVSSSEETTKKTPVLQIKEGKTAQRRETVKSKRSKTKQIDAPVSTDEYLRAEEAIINQKGKDSSSDDIPIALLKLDHDLEQEEIKRKNRGILSSVVTTPESKNAILVTDKILGGVQNFIQKLDPLAGKENPRNDLKEPKKKTFKPKPKPLKKLKPLQSLKNLIKPAKNLPIRRASAKLSLQKKLPPSLFSKAKRNIFYGYKNRFEKNEHSLNKRDLSEIENGVSNDKKIDKRNIKIRQDENEDLINEIYNEIDGLRENQRYSREIPANLLQFDPYSDDDINMRDTVTDDFGSPSQKPSMSFEETLQENQNTKNYMSKAKARSYLYNEKRTDQAVGKNNRLNNQEHHDNKANFKGFPSDRQNHQTLIRQEQEEYEHFPSRLDNDNLIKVNDNADLNDIYEESLYNLVSENNLVSDMNNLVAASNTDTEYEEQEKDVIKNLLKEDLKLKNIYKELNYATDINTDKNYLHPIREKRQTKDDLQEEELFNSSKPHVLDNLITTMAKDYFTQVIKSNNDLDIINKIIGQIINDHYYKENQVRDERNTKKLEKEDERKNDEIMEMVLNNLIKQKKPSTRGEKKKLESNDNSIQKLLKEEVETNHNDFDENFRNKRSAKEMDEDNQENKENEIDDVDIQLLETNKLKNFNFLKDIDWKHKHAYDSYPADHAPSSSPNIPKKVNKSEDLNSFANTAKINTTNKFGRTDQNQIFANKEVIKPQETLQNNEKQNISLKNIPHLNKNENRTNVPLAKDQTNVIPPLLLKLSPMHVRVPRRNVFKIKERKIAPPKMPIVYTRKFTENNSMNNAKKHVPVKMFKMYPKNFNRFKRAKRNVNDSSSEQLTETHLEVGQPHLSILNSTDNGILVDNKSTDPSKQSLRENFKKAADRLYSNYNEDDLRNVIPKNEYEKIIYDEIAKSKLKKTNEMKEGKLGLGQKKIQNEVDLLEYIELQKGKKNKSMKNKTGELDTTQNEIDSNYLRNNNDYIKKYQKIINQVMQHGGVVDTDLPSVGVNNLSNQIELFNEPKSEEVVKDIKSKYEDEGRLVFDDDFQNALIHNSAIETIRPSETSDANIINSIIINPFNDFLTKVNENLRTILNATKKHKPSHNKFNTKVTKISNNGSEIEKTPVTTLHKDVDLFSKVDIDAQNIITNINKDANKYQSDNTNKTDSIDSEIHETSTNKLNTDNHKNNTIRVKLRKKHKGKISDSKNLTDIETETQDLQKTIMTKAQDMVQVLTKVLGNIGNAFS